MCGPDHTTYPTTGQRKSGRPCHDQRRRGTVSVCISVWCLYVLCLAKPGQLRFVLRVDSSCHTFSHPMVAYRSGLILGTLPTHLLLMNHRHTKAFVG